MTTIKELRGLVDAGLIAANEAVGQSVKVGFMTLTITGYRETPGDYRPNVWTLTSLTSGRNYEFTPHYGIERV